MNIDKLSIGQVVYYIKKRGHKWSVHYGIVDDVYRHIVYLQLLDIKNCRRINGIPEKDFVTPTRWEKLPKGWKYDTVLFNLSFDTLDFGNMRIDNPADILEAYNSGLLIKVQDKDYCIFETEIDSKLGWRIVRKCQRDEYHPNYITLTPTDVYETYANAVSEIDKHNMALERQAAMSDYEWSVEQIDHTLNRIPMTDNERKKYRDWLLELPNIEDVEVRYCGGEIQWKYFNKKRWGSIEV